MEVAEVEAEVEKKATATRSRLIVRLAALLVSHSTLVSVVCCLAGLIALLVLPLLAKNTYISENALLPGSANPVLSYQHVTQANNLIMDIMSIADVKEAPDIEIPKLIAKYMEILGAETYHHKFSQPQNQFHPLYFFSSSPNSPPTLANLSYGTSTVGIIRAPRGDGKEAIVLVSPYNTQNAGGIDASASASSIGLAFSVFSLLSRATWLAKDIIWVASDSRFGDHTSVSAWLNDYHNPNFIGDASSNRIFKRAGTMACGIVFKVVEKERREKYEDRDVVTMYAEASNGQMPNLDLLNVVHYLAVHRQGIRVRIGMFGGLVKSHLVRVLGEVMQQVGRFARSLNPDWRFEMPSSEYVEGTATLASSIYSQALGVPTGPHGAFRDYQVDAVTLELSPRFSLKNEHTRLAFLLKGGRLIEGTVRSVNNLLEKFHQSFFLYFLTAPNKFVSVGVYMIPFAFLVAPLPIIAASLFNLTSNRNPWRWLHTAKPLLITHTWSVVVTLLPFYISKISDLPSTHCMLTWAGGSLMALVILYIVFGSPYSKHVEWRLLKAVMIASVSIGLCLMSIINFATAQIGALFVVPMCLFALPIRVKTNNSLIRSMVMTCNLVMAVLGFPVTAVALMQGVIKGFGTVSILEFWDSMKFLWGWNSATYLYLVLVHLPCWLLFLHILFHPCH
ncbi:GPI transamidase component family protein / Gaa1-like family protein [Rhynchospora pubera]|uniref:GPI transamidase component family protein / Gaa1-like family protein n=1 Tax=Rhynchospora pubera TaxID=906938 RepID=A0AAV8C0P7_9POAL|nr:GPI transamidase component family protein / Gaa1-like family protein [Rhynchospora pubera]